MWATTNFDLSARRSMENSPETALPSAEPLAPAPVETPRDIPYWHTALLLLVLGVMSVGNAKTGHHMHSGNSHIRIYLATIIYEWLFTAYVWWGVRRSGGTFREMIGGRWQRVEDFLLDVAIACAAWIGTLVVLAVIALGLGMNHGAANIEDARRQIGFLAPQSGLEVALWVCLSATAGFCEEILFRGYFQKQCTRLLHSRWAALIVVSILFGLGHAYEGPQRMGLIAVLGLSFGVLSLWRKSLRPAMMAHTLQDTISGLLLRALR
jgi:membrane protease YdiL (CAAX protease family)